MKAFSDYKACCNIVINLSGDLINDRKTIMKLYNQFQIQGGKMNPYKKEEIRFNTQVKQLEESITNHLSGLSEVGELLKENMENLDCKKLYTITTFIVMKHLPIIVDAIQKQWGTNTRLYKEYFEYLIFCHKAKDTVEIIEQFLTNVEWLYLENGFETYFDVYDYLLGFPIGKGILKSALLYNNGTQLKIVNQNNKERLNRLLDFIKTNSKYPQLWEEVLEDLD